MAPTLTGSSAKSAEVPIEDSEDEGLVFPSRFRVLTMDKLAALPDPEWLVEGVIPRGSFALLFGPPGIGKSFLALDLALCVATGTSWFQHPIRRPGPVVYLALESLTGFKSRVLAWRGYWGRADIEERHVRFVGESPNLLDIVDVAELARALRASDPELPVLVVIDTLARAAGGADENAAKDMGQVVASLDHLRTLLRNTASETAVLVLHHTPKANTNTPRGSSALLGAVDVALKLDGDSTQLTLTVEKLRDGEAPGPIRLRLEQAEGSAVVVPAGGGTNDGVLPRPLALALEALATTQLPNGSSAGEWMASTQMAHGTFYRARKQLIERGLVELRGTRYTVTSSGYCQVPTYCQPSAKGGLGTTTATAGAPLGAPRLAVDE